MDNLTELEQAVVDKVEEGWARYKIASLLGISESRVRDTIAALCERYQCSMRDLPDKVRKEKSGGQGN